MVEPVVVTVLPVLFLIILFGGGALFRRRSIDMDGKPPIGKGLFYSSKYAILVLWAAMVLHSWGIGLALHGSAGTAEMGCSGPMGGRIHAALHRAARARRLFQDRLCQGEHPLENAWAVPIQPQSDVPGCRCDDSCLRPLYPQSNPAPHRRLRYRRSPQESFWPRNSICRRCLLENMRSIAVV